MSILESQLSLPSKIIHLQSGVSAATLQKVAASISWLGHYRSAAFNWSPESVVELSPGEELFLSVDQTGICEVFGFLKCSVVAARFGEPIELHSIAVKPRLRKHGVASRLFEALIAAYPGKRVLLEVHEANLPALTFYRQRGFRELSLRPSYYGDGGKALIFEWSPD